VAESQQNDLVQVGIVSQYVLGGAGAKKGEVGVGAGLSQGSHQGGRHERVADGPSANNQDARRPAGWLGRRLTLICIEHWGKPASLRIHPSFVDQHHRDVVLDGVNAPALAALQPFPIRGECDRRLA
jgi:hypothetical protein